MIHKTLLTSLMIVLLSACGSQPHGHTRDYLSLSRQLYVVPGSDGGYCVLEKARGGKVRLITTAGALDATQLGQSLSYMSYWSQSVSAVAPLAVPIYAVVRILQRSTKLFEEGVAAGDITAKQRLKLVKMTFGGVVLFGAAHMVNGIFRIVKGFYEGEDIGAISAQFFFGWMPVNFVVEGLQRRGRVRSLLSDYERFSISERKGDRIVASMHSKQPAFPGGCDDIEIEKSEKTSK